MVKKAIQTETFHGQIRLRKDQIEFIIIISEKSASNFIATLAINSYLICSDNLHLFIKI